MASAHVDGKVRVYRFSDCEELQAKHKQDKADLVFSDHFYSANVATFAQNKCNQ